MATLTLRTLTNSGDTTKGSRLTAAEVDQNFINLDNNKVEKSGDTMTGALGIGIAPTNNFNVHGASGGVVAKVSVAGVTGGDYASLQTENSDVVTWMTASKSFSTGYFGTNSAHSVSFTVNGTTRMLLDTSGHLVPATTNTYDLGSTTLRWRNIYTQDLHLSNGIGDYTVIEGEENLYLVNNKSGKSFKFALIEVDPAEVPPKSAA